MSGLPPGWRTINNPAESVPSPDVGLPAGWTLNPAVETNPLQATQQGMSGVNEAIAGAVGFPVDAVNSAINGGLGLWNMVTGRNDQMSGTPVGGSQFFRNLLAPTIKPATNNPIDRAIRTTGQGVGGMAVTGPATGAGIVRSLVTGLMSGGAEAGSNALTNNNPYAGFVAGMAGGLLPSVTSGTRAVNAANNATKASVPTTQALNVAAGSLYKQAEARGVVVPKMSVISLNTQMRDIATNEGIISPTGRVASAYPKVKDALNMFADYAKYQPGGLAKGVMSVPQLQSVRKSLQAAAGSSDANERRIGYNMLNAFDNFAAGFAPELSQARTLYARSMRGDQLETLAEVARSKAGAASGPAYATALSNEYGALERSILKGRERGFSPDLQGAVAQTAQSGKSVATRFGRFAPTSPSGVFLSGISPAAVGGTTGFFLGGPAGAAAGATAFPAVTSAASLAARAAAARATISDAQAAELLARNGVPLAPNAKLTPYLRDMAVRLLATQSQQNPQP